MSDFSPKHYRQIAFVLSKRKPSKAASTEPKLYKSLNQLQHHSWATTVRSFACMLEQDNPDFNRTKFYNQVGLNF